MIDLNANVFNLLILICFILGYGFITIEHMTKINKTSIALLMAISCWALQFFNPAETQQHNLDHLFENLAKISQIVFFLLGALTIVEIISAHRGFQLISDLIRLQSKKKLLWAMGLVSFFLSSVLDNLTTTIIMVTLLRKLTDEGEERLIMGGAIVIAANAGGAWTPIGDVTTTMLWIDGQLSTLAVIQSLFIPSLVCFIVALWVLSLSLKGNFKSVEHVEEKPIEPKGVCVFWLGVACLVSVPIFKITTGLPPFMGILFGLGLMWIVTDIFHGKSEKEQHLTVPNIISRIDISGILFFFGILLTIDALHAAGILHGLAVWMDRVIKNPDLIAIAIGLGSAIVDNVPLVAAAMGMYDLTQFPVDSDFWMLVAYCAGTGGSILVIGSAAGVAFMGLERVEFFWYMRRIGLAALLGYFAGIGAFKLFY